jgi:hypothetical protein
MASDTRKCCRQQIARVHSSRDTLASLFETTLSADDHPPRLNIACVGAVDPRMLLDALPACNEIASGWHPVGSASVVSALGQTVSPGEHDEPTFRLPVLMGASPVAKLSATKAAVETRAL